MNKKGLSIITNFGCDSGCLYCVSKSQARFDKTNACLNTQAIEHALRQFPDIKEVSISGGGDPCFYPGTLDPLIDMFTRCKKTMSIHTTKFHNLHESPLISKIVYHVVTTGPNALSVSSMIRTLTTLPRFCKIRISVVVTNVITADYLKTLEDFAYLLRAQVSYRELVGHQELQPSVELVSFAKSVHSRLASGKYIEQNDYNYYIDANTGKITDKFLEN